MVARVSFSPVVKLNATQWLLDHKLYRPAPGDLTIAFCRAVAARVSLAAICLLSMLLAAWIGALTRILSAHDGHAFSSLNGTALAAASRNAGMYQAGLLPVLLVWAVMLVVTPPGFTLAYRAAVAIAGILGYLHFSPPAFFLTKKVASISRWLIHLDDHLSRAATLSVVVTIAATWVLISNATGIFVRSGSHAARAAWLPDGTFVRGVSALVLALLVLLMTAWSATVIRLATSHPGILESGRQAGLYQSRYLLALTVLAILAARASDRRNWLTAFALLTLMYTLAASTFTVPAAVRHPVLSGLLTNIGGGWGAGSLWAALFLFVPISVLGIYLAGRLLD
jgi:hypothetical protein